LLTNQVGFADKCPQSALIVEHDPPLVLRSYLGLAA